jgi:teichuronic acid biosynthesis glycosyltransferase TuaC
VVKTVKQNMNQNVDLKVVYGVPHEKIPIFLNASEVLLLTSKSEGTPHTVKEALACNLPVVLTYVGDVKLLLTGVTSSQVCNNKESWLGGGP